MLANLLCKLPYDELQMMELRRTDFVFFAFLLQSLVLQSRLSFVA